MYIQTGGGSSSSSSKGGNKRGGKPPSQGGGDAQSHRRRRQEQLEGMNMGPRFEMGYDIEPEVVPLAEDDTLPWVETIAAAADARKGEDLYAIRVSSLTTVSSFFVLVSGNSRPQIQAIAGAIEEDMVAKHGVEPRNGGEGTADSGWILLDYGGLCGVSIDGCRGGWMGGWVLLRFARPMRSRPSPPPHKPNIRTPGSVVVNVMTPVARSYYALEKLWRKGEEVDLSHILKPNAPPGSEATGRGVPTAAEEAGVEREEDPFWS